MFIAQAPIQDALFGFIIVINSGIGIVQEYRAKRTLERLSLVGEAKPVVRRDGADVEVRPAAVVLDDVIVLRTGDQLVVDGAILEEQGLEIDESLLTGEADPVAKDAGDEALSGSFVVSGSGLMQATRVGVDSYATRLASEARKFTVTRSELMGSIMRFVRVMSYILIPVGALLFWSQWQATPDWQTALTGTVAGVVTMIPEGLVLLTSVAMAVAVVRLGRQQALVQEMPAVEVLARVDVVCVDKTGTLTEPGMHLQDVVVLDPGAPVDAALGALGAADDNPNPTQAAVAAAYASPGAGWHCDAIVPFSSARKWSAARFGAHGWWVLGAPEMLLADGDPDRAKADALAGSGARVLLLARSAGRVRPGSPTPAPATSPRPPCWSSTSGCAAMCATRSPTSSTSRSTSRSSPATAPPPWGRSPGRPASPAPRTPYDARGLPEDREAMAEVLDTHSVFGRVTPAQKRAMVGALQSRGHTVAMTGDGVNDVLALKDADLGIAMGSGAGATRAVAQIVLLDNRFAVMPSVVAEGRRVLGNIERVSDLFLTKSFYALVLAVLTGIATLPFPFLPRHLTVISALTIGVPAFFIALMPNKARFRPGFFARVLSFAIPSGVICAAGAFTSYFAALATTDSDVTEARVSATVTLAIMTLFVLYLVARPMDPLRWLIVAVMAAGFLVVLFVPWLSDFYALDLGADPRSGEAVAIGAAGCAALWVTRGLVTRWRAARGVAVGTGDVA